MSELKLKDNDIYVIIGDKKYKLDTSNEVEYNLEKEDILKTRIEKIAEDCFGHYKWYGDSENKSHLEITKDRRCMSRESFIKMVYKAFKNEKLIKLNGEWHRGIGKTTFLGCVSNIFNIPLITSNIANSNSSFFSKVYHIGSFGGVKLDGKYVLIDEGLSMNDVDNIRKQGFIPLGFITEIKKYDFY